MLGQVIAYICGMIFGVVLALIIIGWLAEKITGRVW